MVRGPAGVGKSWLVGRMLEIDGPAISATQTVVLRAAGHPAESDLPFAGLHQLLLPLRPEIERLPSPQRTAIERALARQPVGAGHRFATAAGLHGLLATLSERRPVLIVIEDLQWLDGSTTTCLVFAIRRLGADRVAVVLTTRDPMQPTGLDADDIELALLDRDGAREILGRLHPDLAPSVRDEVVRVAGGLPVVLREGPADLTADQRRGLAPLPTVLPIGSTLSWIYRQRLESMGSDGRFALLVASLERLEHPRIAKALAAVGLDATALDTAEDAGLLDRSGPVVTLSHATLGTAVQARASAPELERARRAVASALVDEPHRQVWFLDGSIEVSDDELAAKWEAAAIDAERRGAWAEAGTARERAARRSTGSDCRRQLMAASVSHARGGGPSSALRLLDELIAEADDPDEQLLLEGQRITARSWSHTQHIDAEAVRDLIAAHPDASPHAVASILASVAVTSLLWGSHGDALAAVDEAHATLGLDAASPPDRLIRDIVEVVGGRVGAGSFLRSEWLGELSDDELLDPTIPAFLASFVLAFTDDDDRSETVARRLRDVAGRIGDLSQLALATALIAMVEQHRGDMLAARAHYSTAIGLCLDTEFMAPVTHLQLRHAHLLAALGQEEACRSLVASASGGVNDSPAIQHLATATLGLLELTGGNCTHAVDLLVDAEARLVAMQVGEPGYITQAGDLVEALWRLRRTDEAHEVVERSARRAERVGRHSALAIAHRGRGLLADPASIDEQFLLAHRHHALAPDRYQQARTDLCWGMQLRRARRKRDARTPLRDALAAFEAMGASPWAAQAAAELTACGERRRTAWAAVDELTPRELEVAVVVADGATNPAAAAALCISTRTVEDHLTRIYRKLAIAGRDELPSALARPAHPPADSRI